MASCALKNWAKKHQKLYAFLWGMPLYRKVMYCLHNHLTRHVQCVGTHRFDVAARMVDMFLCLWIYGCSYSEYNLYGFNELKHRERSKFICDCCRKRYYMQLNSVADMDVFRNKYQAYEKFKKYYNRRACVFQTSQGFEEFTEIIESYKTAVIKPTTASGGYGVIKVSIDEVSSLAVCFDEICSVVPCGDIIIEEYVQQMPEISALHSSSLNTARIITIIDRTGDSHILGAFFRVGVNGKIVDNGASGGILCELSDSGVILRCRDKDGKEYTHHPNTGHPLVGFQIPKWDAAKKTALRLSKKIPTTRFCGWDLALTNDGWIMIEGNETSEFIGIQIFGKACKPALDKYL